MQPSGEESVTHASRYTLSVIALSCLLSLGGIDRTQAQGLKTRSENFGSGWQVGAGSGSTNRDTSADRAAGGRDTSGSEYSATSPAAGGMPPGGYTGYTGTADSSSARSGPDGSSSGYGGSGSAYGNDSSGAASAPDTASPYSTPRSAGGGLRTQ